MLIVRAFINDAIAVAVWTSFRFHVCLVCTGDCVRITRQYDQSASDRHPVRENYSPVATPGTLEIVISRRFEQLSCHQCQSAKRQNHTAAASTGIR